MKKRRKPESPTKKLDHCYMCGGKTCPVCKACWSKDCIECVVRLSLRALEHKKEVTLIEGFGLEDAIDAVLPKMSDMDRKIIEARRDNVDYLRQCHAFLSPLIRELRGER